VRAMLFSAQLLDAPRPSGSPRPARFSFWQ
jgi:hypothetical protein